MLVFMRMSHSNFTFVVFFKIDSVSSLVECTSIMIFFLHFETYFVWAPMVQVHRAKEKYFNIMNVMF